VVEAVLLHQRHQLGAEAAGAGGFVHHHAAAGLFTDSTMVSRSSGHRLRRSMTSASTPLSSAATCDTYTVVP
jgi:hypothetical protein